MRHGVDSGTRNGPGYGYLGELDRRVRLASPAFLADLIPPPHSRAAIAEP